MNHSENDGAPIVLLGFMGSGKSYWGKQWAEHLHYNFVDLDNRIIEAENSSVSRIFEKKGEPYFRKLEADILRSLTEPNTVVACGGGTSVYEENLNWMNKNGITIYLKAPASYLLENIKKEPGQRPLIKETNEAELLFFIQQKLKERDTFYGQAKYILEVEKVNLKSLQNIIKTNTSKNA